MQEFKDKVAVVTGAASGIGKAIAEKFGLEGMKIVLADIEKESLSQAEQDLTKLGIEVIAVKTDVSKIDDVRVLAQTTLKSFGAVHILVNNAGVGFAGECSTTLWESSLSEWQWILGVNVWGVINGIRVFTPIMLQQDYKSYIINTSSIAGLIKPQPGAGIYSITKHAVLALSESLQADLTLVDNKIKVFALCPGFVSTKITDSERNRPNDDRNNKTTNPRLETIKKAYHQIISNGISPEIVAEKVFLALNDEKFYIPTDSHKFIKGHVKNRFDKIITDFSDTIKS
ncbi:MAG: SDR family NAD(P)-dependent oxidoreductase [Promethearchaeota archaeon]|jgi:NAD(P)-dependent dehydrogenase (short-subunit alcohol dehydrogenase family)